MSLNVTSGIVYSSGPTITVNATPVNIFGAAAASASGTAGITHYSGALNVNISGGTISANVSGNIVRIASSGSIPISDYSGALNVNISGGTISANVSGNVVVIAASGGSLLLSEGTGANATLRASLWAAGSQVGAIGGNADALSNINAGLNSIGAASETFLFNGTNYDRARTVDALSGGKQSGIGILAATALAFDYSGAAYRMLSTTGSGQTLLQVSPFGLQSGTFVLISGGGASLSGLAVSASGNVVTVSGNVVYISGAVGVSSGGTLPVNPVSGAYVFGYQWNNITTAAVTNVQSGASILHAVAINLWLSGGQVRIDDSMSGVGGTTFGIIDFQEVGSLAANAFAPQVMQFDAYMKSGIVVSTSGALNVTVLYRNPV